MSEGPEKSAQGSVLEKNCKQVYNLDELEAVADKVTKASEEVYIALRQLPNPGASAAELTRLLPALLSEIGRFLEVVGFVTHFDRLPVCHQEIGEDEYEILDANRRDSRVKDMLLSLQNTPKK